jgi:hypothetical protein
MESQLTAAAVPADLFANEAQARTDRSNRGYLWFAYIGAIIIPIVGAIVAIYTGVSERRAAIRRHAFGIAAAAILSGVVWAVAITTINKSTADNRVAGDLSLSWTSTASGTPTRPARMRPAASTRASSTPS